MDQYCASSIAKVDFGGSKMTFACCVGGVCGWVQVFVRRVCSQGFVRSFLFAGFVCSQGLFAGFVSHGFSSHVFRKVSLTPSRVRLLSSIWTHITMFL